MSISHDWTRVTNWYEGHVADFDPKLATGATAGDIRDAEEALGVELPADVRESYLIHNGSQNALFPSGYYLLSLEEVIDEWTVWCDLLEKGEVPSSSPETQGAVKRVWWSTRWIPFSHSGGGDHQCIDLDPPTGGTWGQVIDFDHERGPRQVCAASFSVWLADFAAALETGQYLFDGTELVVAQC
jgi:cell wall assembly regulator SMI1